MRDSLGELGQSGRTHRGEGTAPFMLWLGLSASTTERPVTGRGVTSVVWLLWSGWEKSQYSRYVAKWHIIWSLDATWCIAYEWEKKGVCSLETAMWGHWQHFSFFPWGLAGRRLICYSHHLHPLYHPSHNMHFPPEHALWGRSSADVENACDASAHVWPICSHVFTPVLSEPMCSYKGKKKDSTHTPSSQLEPSSACRDGKRNRMWLPLNQWFARLLQQPVAVLICHRI